MQSIYRLFKISQLIVVQFINFFLIKGTRYNSYKETLLGFYASVLLLIVSQAAVSSPTSLSNLRLIIGDLFEVIEIQEGCRWALKLVDDGREPIAEWADYAEGMTKLMKGIEGQQIEVVSLNSLYTELYLLVNKGEVSLENKYQPFHWSSHICLLKTDFTARSYPYHAIGKYLFKSHLNSVSNPELPKTERHRMLQDEIPKLKTNNEIVVKGMGDKIVKGCLDISYSEPGYRKNKSIMEKAGLDAWTAQKIYQAMEVDDQASGNINITILDRISSGVVFSLFDLIQDRGGRYNGSDDRHRCPASDYGMTTDITEYCYSSLLFYRPQTKELYPPCDSDSGRYEVRLNSDPVEVVVTQLPKCYQQPKAETITDALLKEITEDMRVGTYNLKIFNSKEKVIKHITDPYEPCNSNHLGKPNKDAITSLVSYIHKEEIDMTLENIKNTEDIINNFISEISEKLQLE